MHARAQQEIFDALNNWFHANGWRSQDGGVVNTQTGLPLVRATTTLTQFIREQAGPGGLVVTATYSYDVGLYNVRYGTGSWTPLATELSARADPFAVAIVDDIVFNTADANNATVYITWITVCPVDAGPASSPVDAPN